MTSISMNLRTWFFGEWVGNDNRGNRYYQEKIRFTKPHRPLKRWVIYNGQTKGSMVCPRWFGWLHHTFEGPLLTPPYDWEKEHTPNPSGTCHAYRPSGSLYNHQHPSHRTYDPWRPEIF